MTGPLMLLIIIVAGAAFFGFTATGRGMIASLKNKLKGMGGNGNGNNYYQQPIPQQVIYETVGPEGMPELPELEGLGISTPQDLAKLLHNVSTNKEVREDIRKWAKDYNEQLEDWAREYARQYEI